MFLHSKESGAAFIRVDVAMEAVFPHHLQIWNEPDGGWAFHGGPRGLRAHPLRRLRGNQAQCARGHRRAGGIMRGSDERGGAWLNAAFSTPGVSSWAKFDIAAVHLRGRAAGLAPALPAWREFLRYWRRYVPLWVTEHGYPSDGRWQGDPAFVGGDRGQAAYLSTTLPTLALAGADQVFVTLRDGGGGQFDSEGILEGTGRPGGTLLRKPAWYAVRHAALSWPPPSARVAGGTLKPAGPCARFQSGGDGRDLLRGTPDGDRLEGLRGADRLDGRAADDCLRGGTGDDRLAGGAGNDRLGAAGGADRLSGGDGGDGGDVLRGGRGWDTFDAGSGRDQIEAADGVRETVRCGRGRDTVTADRADRLIGCERVRRRGAYR